MSHQPSPGAMARKAHAEHVLENLTPHDPFKAICASLAEVWIQGDQQQVRTIIKGGLTPEARARMANGTRALLPNDLMKDAFDSYMSRY